MMEQEIRMECMGLARSVLPDDATKEDLINTAQEIYLWIMQGKKTPVSTKLVN